MTKEQLSKVAEEQKERLQALDEAFPVSLVAEPERSAVEQFPPIVVDGVKFGNGVYVAKTVADVQKLVDAARRDELKLRVAGSQHSVKAAVFSGDKRDMRVALDGELRLVTVISQDEAGAVVRAGAGCYLGKNPSDPTSTWSNSLNGQLEALGVALPILGGISHQTIAGFLQTSSSGGSLRHGIAEALVAIEWVDGLSHVQSFRTGSAEFYAAGVAMGLFGVITHVTFRCEPRYFVDGAEQNFEMKDSLLEKANGRYLLEDALARNDYLHLNWFAQRHVMRTMQWVGNRVQSMEPFVPYDSVLRSKWMTLLAAAVLRVGNLLTLFDPNDEPVATWIGDLLLKFVPLDEPNKFHDFWYRALPSDDQVDVDNLISLHFTEIWLPLSQLTPALDRLIPAIAAEQRMAGNFAIEFYAARESPFWMSPANGRDVFRVDVFWWKRNLGDALDFFGMYWDQLLELPGARLHWGKFLPIVGKKYGKVTFGPEFIRKAYSDHIEEWLELRTRFDPKGVFLTSHWKSVFGI